MKAMKRFGLWLTLGVGMVAMASPALAANGNGVKYTHASTLTQEQCTVFENYPKPGVPVRTWTAARRSPTGQTHHLGVRYTYNSYALVLDHSRTTSPSWGFVAKSCLTDPYAYDGAGHRLGDLSAIGGNGAVKAVPVSAAHDGKKTVATLHVGNGTVGTLRSAARSFVIGNVRDGDPFQITTAHCGHHNPEQWILGYAPDSGRWGYAQARVLPACA
jgi:hypothetical protein